MLGEECGVFGIYNPKGDCAHSTYYGLMALQHRGQESAGIAVNCNRKIDYYKDNGLVNQIFTEEILDKLHGTMACGHVRYSTAGGSGRENAQPLVLRYVKGNLALAHNGNLVNTSELKKEYEQSGAIYQTTADTEIIAYTIARERIHTPSIQQAVVNSMNRLKGAYSLVIMSPQKLIAARDPWGFRPLCMGRKGEAILFASESCALDAVGARFERDIEPGEVVVVENGRVSSLREHCNREEQLRFCIFEYIYFARPDSIINGQFVGDARRLAGKFLAQEYPVEADIVIGVPDSGLYAAVGYGLASGIPVEEGFVKNRYIARTFIKPKQTEREKSVRLKLNPLKRYIEGKRVVMVDDSIVRGTTCQRIVHALREAGAKEVHVRISSPPFRCPCFYGTDIPNKKELVTGAHSIEEIREIIGADTLGYLSLKHLHQIAPDASTGFCDACFTGDYAV